MVYKHSLRNSMIPVITLFASILPILIGGSVIVRQRPGTAKGMLFITLEDESGMAQAIVSPDLLQENRSLLVGAPGLVVEGILQKRDGSLSVRAERFRGLTELVTAGSHDFH